MRIFLLSPSFEILLSCDDLQEIDEEDYVEQNLAEEEDEDEGLGKQVDVALEGVGEGHEHGAHFDDRQKCDEIPHHQRSFFIALDCGQGDSEEECADEEGEGKVGGLLGRSEGLAVGALVVGAVVARAGGVAAVGEQKVASAAGKAGVAEGAVCAVGGADHRDGNAMRGVADEWRGADAEAGQVVHQVAGVALKAARTAAELTESGAVDAGEAVGVGRHWADLQALAGVEEGEGCVIAAETLRAGEGARGVGADHAALDGRANVADGGSGRGVDHSVEGPRQCHRPHLEVFHNARGKDLRIVAAAAGETAE
jgi:hypothetical protein